MPNSAGKIQGISVPNVPWHSPIKVMNGTITITEQLYRQVLDNEEAVERHAERMANDPEYRAEWRRQQAEREDDE